MNLGCGKSTLGRAILRLHEPTAGKVIYKGMDITSFSLKKMRKMRQHMQIIFQDPYASLNPRFTISRLLKNHWCFIRFIRVRQRERQELQN